LPAKKQIRPNLQGLFEKKEVLQRAKENGATIAFEAGENLILNRGVQMQSMKPGTIRFAILLTMPLALSAVALVVSTPVVLGQEAKASETATLSLSEAVDLALKHNLQSVVAKERIAQAKGGKGVSLSALLPNISGSAYQASQTLNLASLGLPVGKMQGISPFTGEFKHFDARIQMSQNIFNLSALRRYQASKYEVKLSVEQQKLSTQQITTATAISYLTVLAAEQAVDAANSNVQLAQTLLALAANQRKAGLANGIDVARAETRLANQQVQLAQAQTDLDNARLELQRLLCGVDGQIIPSSIRLSDAMRLTVDPSREAEEAVKQALNDRVEVKVASEMLQIATTQHKAANADLLPTVGIFGDYGSSGLKPNDTDYATRNVGVRLDLPIFNGGRTHSEIKVAASRQRESEAQLQDVRAAVEKDVRQALLNVKTREEQVRAAQMASSLGERELVLAQDRFKNGVADNVEVVNAQTVLEDARLRLVSSLAQFNVARLNLASALGHVEDFRL